MEVKLKEDRVKYWLGVGAQPTDTVRTLLRSEGLILKVHLEKKGTAPETIDTQVQKFLADKESKIIRARDKKSRRTCKEIQKRNKGNR